MGVLHAGTALTKVHRHVGLSGASAGASGRPATPKIEFSRSSAVTCGHLVRYWVREQGFQGMRFSPIYHPNSTWLNSKEHYPLWGG